MIKLLLNKIAPKGLCKHHERWVTRCYLYEGLYPELRNAPVGCNGNNVKCEYFQRRPE